MSQMLIDEPAAATTDTAPPPLSAFEAEDAQLERERAQAATLYRQILEREAEGRALPGDGKALPALRAKLGLTTADRDADLSALRNAAHLANQIRPDADLDAQLDAARAQRAAAWQSFRDALKDAVDRTTDTALPQWMFWIAEQFWAQLQLGAEFDARTKGAVGNAELALMNAANASNANAQLKGQLAALRDANPRVLGE